MRTIVRREFLKRNIGGSCVWICIKAMQLSWYDMLCFGNWLWHEILQRQGEARWVFPIPHIPQKQSYTDSRSIETRCSSNPYIVVQSYPNRKCSFKTKGPYSCARVGVIHVSNISQDPIKSVMNNLQMYRVHLLLAIPRLATLSAHGLPGHNQN